MVINMPDDAKIEHGSEGITIYLRSSLIGLEEWLCFGINMGYKSDINPGVKSDEINKTMSQKD
jgi:hypothetical protein